VVVAGAAGWWFLIREDNQLATAPQEFRDTPAANATDTPSVGEPTTTPVAQASEGYELFTIVPENPAVDGQTGAAYFADEQLASLGVPSTAKGTTPGVTGTFSIGPDGLDPAVPTTITVDLTSLKSDENRRDNRVRDALQISRFPTASFMAERLEGWSGLADGGSVAATIVGTLELHGVQKEISWDIQAVRQGDVISALATTNFLFADFGIPVPNIGGFVSVQDDVTLQVQLIAEIAK
jgi:polyisoprenoid-binding protein YceI